MREESSRFEQGSDSVELRGGASAQAGELREDEPNPVAALLSRLQFAQRDVELAFLRLDEPCELKRISGVNHMSEGREGWRGINGPTPTNR